jgi:hypothetical protein
VTAGVLPTPPPQSYNIVQDLTDPQGFNFVALTLSVGILLIVVGVTMYGFCQRYALVRKKQLAYYRYRRHRCSTPERWQLYFEEDIGSVHDANSFVRGAYTVAPATPNRNKAAVPYVQLPTRIVSTTQTNVNM